MIYDMLPTKTSPSYKKTSAMKHGPLAVLLLQLWSLVQDNLAFAPSAAGTTTASFVVRRNVVRAGSFGHPRINVLYSSEDKLDTERSAASTRPQSTNEADAVDPPTTEREFSSEEMMRALNTSPRRILISTLASSSIALAANFLGVTSNLLSIIPESTVEASGLDVYYPRGDYKRFRSSQGYTFVYPKEWVADTALELVKANQRKANLDYAMPKRRSAGSSTVIPDAAFGPPGRLNARGVSQGDTNVSVILSTLLPGFSLRGTLGSPNDAAETLLRVSLAPEGSGKKAALVDAFEDEKRELYQFEYTLDRGDKGLPLRAISLIVKLTGDTLLTLTVVAPQVEWTGSSGTKLRKIASSFRTYD